MRSRFLALLALSVAAVIGVGVALATPPVGLTPGPPHARGSAERLRISDESLRLSLKAKSATDVQVVSATLAAGGYTGWHTHAGPSLAIVKSGELTMYRPASRRDDDDDDDDDAEDGARCEISVHRAGSVGSAFVHPEGVHTFRNTAAGPTEFYIVYFLPPGQSPAPDISPPTQSACPGIP